LSQFYDAVLERHQLGVTPRRLKREYADSAY
jgi:hypothetical protein